jgi:hypothetical protein
MPALWSELQKLDPGVQGQVKFVSKLPLKDIDAIIATGSDNTSRYFRFNYQNIPRIIRSNRSSVAIIRGTETDKQLQLLGYDIYSYFGRGCRNVSKLLVPQDYQFEGLIACQKNFRNLLKNHKYSDNYRYQKALNLIHGTNHIDTGFSLLSKNQSIVSPLSVIYYENYLGQHQLTEMLSLSRHRMQCIASADGWFDQSFPFGSLQQPDLWDYADNIDTMEFLLKL